MSDAWKKHDRPCPPCANCGAELYEKFWGNGGWAKTDKATGEAHSERDCIVRLTTAIKNAGMLVKTDETSGSTYITLPPMYCRKEVTPGGRKCVNPYGHDGPCVGC
jgi:hypothetical protein